jgi:hypothetical protein
MAIVSGTRVLTARGEIAVERLCEGDAVETTSGAWRSVLFLGHRRVDCARHPSPRDVWPVRVRAGAFADSVPQRDLLLSPDHAIYIDDVLIPARDLINDVTIVQEAIDQPVYWQVELNGHDVLFAEGLPCATSPDEHGRAPFQNGGKVTQLHPRFAAAASADAIFTRPPPASETVAAIQRYLIDRSRDMAAGAGRETAWGSLIPG